jgi:hypothetical protein
MINTSVRIFEVILCERFSKPTLSASNPSLSFFVLLYSKNLTITLIIGSKEKNYATKKLREKT